MPRVDIMDGFGNCFAITTRQKATLFAWFDEVLPHCHIDPRPGIDDFERIWPQIRVWPMFAWPSPNDSPYGDADWLQDSRVLGANHVFPADDGESGLRELAALRKRLEAELALLHDPATG